MCVEVTGALCARASLGANVAKNEHSVIDPEAVEIIAEMEAEIEAAVIRARLRLREAKDAAARVALPSEPHQQPARVAGGSSASKPED